MTWKMLTGTLVLAGALVLAANPVSAEADTLEGMPLVFTDTFADGADGWEMTDPKAWKVVEEDGNPVLSLERLSRYEPPVRSPKSVAWAKSPFVGSFIMEVRAKQTGREYGHRDLCFFFGRQDADKFYYVHLATEADPHANSIFLVNEEPRVSIAEERTSGTDWGTDAWQTVRIRRDVDSGLIAVYYNDMETPVMVAHDTTFTSGAVGVGSFDDTGRFDYVKVWGELLPDGESGKKPALQAAP